MKSIFSIAWARFNLIAQIAGEVQGWLIVTGLYFTLVVPFALGAKLFTDPLHLKSEATQWHSRPDVPTDLDSAREQG